MLRIPWTAAAITISSCSILPAAAGCVNNNDYTWTVGDPNVAAVSTFGFVVARNPGVTSVYATLNGTTSAACDICNLPAHFDRAGLSSDFTSATPVPPFTTADTSDLDSRPRAIEEYVTATLKDANGNNVVTAPLNYVTSDPLTGSFNTVLPLIAKLTANTSGRFSMVAACEPPNCNNAVYRTTLCPSTQLPARHCQLRDAW